MCSTNFEYLNYSVNAIKTYSVERFTFFRISITLYSSLGRYQSCFLLFIYNTELNELRKNIGLRKFHFPL